jgi:purine nucleoside phosphorylase
MSFLSVGGVETIALRGRLHLYEGHAPQVVVSTVLEAIAARHMGARVIAFSLITNAAGFHDEGGHEAVLAEGAARAEGMASLIGGLVAAIDLAT